MIHRKPYYDRNWLYEHYVKKRMKMSEIRDLLKEKYNIEVSEQTIYNHCKKNDLLKYRGKGRNLNAGKRAQSKKVVHPARKRAEMMRKKAKNRKNRR